MEHRENCTEPKIQTIRLDRTGTAATEEKPTVCPYEGLCTLNGSVHHAASWCTSQKGCIVLQYNHFTMQETTEFVWNSPFCDVHQPSSFC